MRENYEAVGFIPEPAVAEQYIANNRYLLIDDDHARRCGYLLHGAMQYGRPVNVAQHCIQDELRRNGRGITAVRELVERAAQVGVSVITVRCATDLESLNFWRAAGFQDLGLVKGGARRERTIARLYLPVSAPLFEGLSRG